MAEARQLMLACVSEAADRAMLFALKALAAVWRSADVQGSAEQRTLFLSDRLRGHRAELAFGLHMGWCVSSLPSS